MKKLSLILCLILVLSLVACGKKKSEETETQPETSAITTTESSTADSDKPAETTVETVSITAPDGSVITETVGEPIVDESIDINRLPKGYAGEDVGLTAKKWKETTHNIATMVLNDDGTGVFENADVKFFWYFENNMLTLHYDVNFGNVTPTTFLLSTENGQLTLTEATDNGAVFIQE